MLCAVHITWGHGRVVGHWRYWRARLACRSWKWTWGHSTAQHRTARREEAVSWDGYGVQVGHMQGHGYGVQVSHMQGHGYGQGRLHDYSQN